jgi:hypothetical protein
MFVLDYLPTSYWLFRCTHPSLPFLSSLIRDPNNATSGPPPGITRDETLLMAALPQIIRASMHDDGASQHGVFADQLDVLVGDGSLAVALPVGVEVAQVADVAG